LISYSQRAGDSRQTNSNQLRDGTHCVAHSFTILDQTLSVNVCFGIVERNFELFDKIASPPPSPTCGGG
jgi:hypothetical protein